jgi:hypothetical protein
MPDYRRGAVTVADSATGLVTVTVDGTDIIAQALGILPAAGQNVWIEQRGQARQDWVVTDVHAAPPVPPPAGTLVATSTGNNSIASTGAGAEQVAAASTAGLGLAAVALSSLRPYRVEIVGRANQIGTAAMIITVRASTGTVTTSSTLIARGQYISAASGGPGATDPSLASPPWTPASTGAWNVAIGAASGSGVVSSWGPAGTWLPVISIYAA